MPSESVRTSAIEPPCDSAYFFSNPALAASDGIRQTLDLALRGKTAYLIENDSFYYFAPLRIGSGQVGVIRFYDSFRV
ncbi:hypothetical protein SAMN02799624_04263 [Paenibacillus sp. UNC496MF]|uniref:hypothetical protein n=1 Tax=Paenibacillus sp. UNC496MF TaxID=1502753 RepID=UPI0008E384DE|nr:hypothetical protein [Paenibacillus sp. UNC496MF]SFJ36293.1 hypothetical protein SAMN02799624_04263 [Paenibacillus sp. UNC496MF]